MLLNSTYVFLFLYLFYVIGACFVYYIQKRNVAITLFLLTSICVGIMAFINEPNSSLDLSRYYNWIYLAGIHYHDIYEAIADDTLFIRQIIFYLCAQVECFQIYAAIPSFLAYFCPLYIFYDFARRYNISLGKLLFCGGIYVCIADYILITNVVRFPIVIILFVFIYYLECLSRIKTIYALSGYLLLSFFHSIGFAFVLLRLLINVESNLVKKVICCCLLGYGGVIQGIFSYLLPYAHIDFMFLLLGQFDDYLINNSSIEAMGSDFYKSVYYVIILFCTSVFMKIYKKYQHEVVEMKFFNLWVYDLLLCIGSLFVNMEIVSRFVFPLIIILVMLIAFALNKLELKKGIYIVAIVISFIGIIYTSRFYAQLNFYLNIF